MILYLPDFLIEDAIPVLEPMILNTITLKDGSYYISFEHKYLDDFTRVISSLIELNENEIKILVFITKDIIENKKLDTSALLYFSKTTIPTMLIDTLMSVTEC